MSTELTRKEAVELCVAIGYKTAGTWDKQRMQRKLIDLAEMAADSGVELGEDVNNFEALNVLLQGVVAAKGEVRLVKKKENTTEAKPKTAEKKLAEKVEAVRVARGKPEQSEPSNVSRPRGRKRLIACGKVLHELGMDDPTFELKLTPALIAKVDEVFGKENKVQSEACLIQAWSALIGYLKDVQP